MELTATAMQETHEKVLNDKKYGKEFLLIKEILCKEEYKLNTDINIIALKIALIDVTNSTHISQHKKKISLYALAEIIQNIPNIDERIEKGDVSVVNDIAKATATYPYQRNFFSFASKYCHYHSLFVYGHDYYPIYDTVVSKNLYRYEPHCKKGEPEKWRNSIRYDLYKEQIDKVLANYKLIAPEKDAPYTEFDHFVWYPYRKDDGDNQE